MSEFNCTECALHKTRGRFYVRGKGNPEAKIFVIGDFPSRHDADKGAHYMSDAGIVFGKALAEAGLVRTDIFCSYLTICHSDSGEPTAAEIHTCAKHLDKEVSYVKPKVIVLLGDLAIRSILGKEPSGSTKSRIWDSGECMRAFSFAQGANAYLDEATGEVTASPAIGAFKVVVGPSPVEVLGSPGAAKDLARAFQNAVKLSNGNMDASVLDYHYAHNEEAAFKMLSELLKRCDTEKLL